MYPIPPSSVGLNPHFHFVLLVRGQGASTVDPELPQSTSRVLVMMVHNVADCVLVEVNVKL